MKTTNVLALCMIAVIISFLGFVVENVWLAVTKGYMDNRNMCFPFLIGYGIAILLIFMIFGTTRKMWFFGKTIRIQSKLLRVLLYFLGVMVCICLGEVLLGKFVEKVCHFFWWDYSGLPLHITRYTSIPTSSMFSFLITFFMDSFFEPLYQYFQTWDYIVLSRVAITLIVLMAGDFVYNAYLMYKKKGMVTRWKINTTQSRLYKKLHTT